MDGSPDALVIRLGIVGAVVLAVVAFGVARKRRRERAFEPRVAMLPDDAFPEGPRAPITAFYFTSRLCSECRETPGVVREADSSVPVVPLHVHERPDLVRALGVFETPTLLLADDMGRIRYARVGNPSPAELRIYIAEAVDSSWDSARTPSPRPSPRGTS